MKILTLIHDYLPLHVGGTEVHAHELARAMRARGHEVVALFSERDLSRAEGELRESEIDGVRTIERVHQREYADVAETWSNVGAEADFARIVAREEPDVVHVHHLAGWGPACLTIARELGARVVMTLHDYFALCDRATLTEIEGSICESGVALARSTPDPSSRACGSCLARHPMRRVEGSRDEALRRAADARRDLFATHLASADAILSPTRFLAGVYERARMVRPGAIEIMPYGFSGRLCEPRTSARGRALRIGYVGGLYFEKGVHVLVEAMRHLRRRDVELHVHGVLEWFPNYVARLRDLAQGSRVEFHGGFEQRDVDAIYRSFDVLCAPSVWFENHPLAIQDAFRHGVPVVASSLGGMAEMIKDGVDGLTFAASDASALAHALERIAVDPALYDELARNRPVLAPIAEVARRIEALYETTASGIA